MERNAAQRQAPITHALLHDMQTPPSNPHFVFRFPVRHEVPSQHPAQVAGSQVQVPPTQRRPTSQTLPEPQPHCPLGSQLFERVVTQEVQERPAVPHVVAVDERHVVPSQQPLGHVEALQLEVVMHTPPSAEQLEPAPHEAQLRPPTPHAVLEVPLRHTPEEQQPVQFDGPQGSTHCLLLHEVVHAEQVEPPDPHAV